MALKKRLALLILVGLLMGTPLALAAANETAVPTHTPSLSQTAVRAVLRQFADPGCNPVPAADTPDSFDMAQPMPACWLAAEPGENP
ncbi:MAG: hypothetical protein IPM53_31630 [Anaerolineaceae bacterium]|nr:hypothetical protein [Anaerolineaceae bacterium]